MRAWIWLVVAAGLIAWVAVPRLGPQPPDPRLWTFEQYEQDRQSFEAARARAQIHEDPERRKLRQAVLTAASRLEYAPCDTRLQPPLRHAIAAHLLLIRNTIKEPIETATMDGRAVDATAFLNTATSDVIREARTAGLVYSEDLPAEIGILFPSRPPQQDHSWYSGRFACTNGERK
jgi:hypothetical protein